MSNISEKEKVAVGYLSKIFVFLTNGYLAREFDS